MPDVIGKTEHTANAKPTLLDAGSLWVPPSSGRQGATAIYQSARKLRDKSIAKKFKGARWVLLKNPLDLIADQSGTLREIKRFGGVLCRAYQLKELDTKPRHLTHPSPTPATAHPAPSPLAYHGPIRPRAALTSLVRRAERCLVARRAPSPRADHLDLMVSGRGQPRAGCGSEVIIDLDADDRAGRAHQFSQQGGDMAVPSSARLVTTTRGS